MVATIAQFLSGTATQGVADAYAETAITTNLDPAKGMGFKILRIDFAFDTTVALQSIAADSLFYFGLSRDTKAAVVEMDDTDCIMRMGVAIALVTSGMTTLPYEYSFTPPDGVFIVEPTTYLQLDSVATGLTLIMHARIYYEEVKLSEIEILRLLNN
jgi:hypothetical protein